MKTTILKVLILITLSLSTSYTTDKVPKDAHEFKGHFYKVFDTSLSWQEAEQKCIDMGGILASVKSEEVNNFLYKLSKGKCLWLGASDELEEGQWIWRDGSPMNYTNWASKEPDNWYDGKEHWIVISWPSARYDNGKWGDTRDHKREQIVGFICEWIK